VKTDAKHILVRPDGHRPALGGYMSNLATSSLSGVGTYTVYAEIEGATASNPAVFDLK
jgi:hypothetical protein